MSIGRALSAPLAQHKRSRVVSVGSEGAGGGAGAGVGVGGGEEDTREAFPTPGPPARRESVGRFDGGSVRHGSVASGGRGPALPLLIGHGLGDVSRGKHGKPVQQLLSILVLPPDVKVNLGGMVAARAVRYLGKLDSSVRRVAHACLPLARSLPPLLPLTHGVCMWQGLEMVGTVLGSPAGS